MLQLFSHQPYVPILYILVRTQKKIEKENQIRN